MSYKFFIVICAIAIVVAQVPVSGQSVKDGQGSGQSVKDGQGSGQSVKDGQGSGQSVKDGQGSGQSVKDGQGIGQSVKDGQGSGQSVKDGQGSGQSVKDGQGSGQSVKDGQGSGQGSGQSSSLSLQDEKDIERPCKEYDLNCIRKYFVKHAKCKPVYGPVPEPVRRRQSTMYHASVNLTVTFTDNYIYGLNGRVEEFYIDKKTDKLVIAVEFRGHSTLSKLAFFRYHRRAKEPLITADKYDVTYRSLVMTAVIPELNDLRLEKASVFCFANDGAPKLYLGPGIFKSKDPEMQRALAEFVGNSQVRIQESLLTDSPFSIATYIQHVICDFGFKFI